MILIDSDLSVALFDPADSCHACFVEILQTILEPMAKTAPVLTEVLHFLQSSSVRARKLMDFINCSGIEVLYLDKEGLRRAFALMARYSYTPMDSADASLVVAAARHTLQSTFPADRNGLLAPTRWLATGVPVEGSQQR